jgi:hypothetical protein
MALAKNPEALETIMRLAYPQRFSPDSLLLHATPANTSGIGKRCAKMNVPMKSPKS